MRMWFGVERRMRRVATLGLGLLIPGSLTAQETVDFSGRAWETGLPAHHPDPSVAGRMGMPPSGLS